MAEPHDAIVLAGGSARRLGGVDKTALVVGAETILDRVLAAVDGAARVVVVGPTRTTARPVSWCREDPPGGGPVAGLAAGLAEVSAGYVLVLAGDLPFVTAGVVGTLLDAVSGHDGALLTDNEGREQLLAGVWRTDALVRALPSAPSGARLGPVLLGLNPIRVGIEQLAELPPPWFDCDTEDDLATARGMA